MASSWECVGQSRKTQKKKRQTRQESVLCLTGGQDRGLPYVSWTRRHKVSKNRTTWTADMSSNRTTWTNHVDKRYARNNDESDHVNMRSNKQIAQNFIIVLKLNVISATQWGWNWVSINRRGQPQTKQELIFGRRSVLLAAVDQIKGSSIHPLGGSCLGYYLIPYFCQLDVQCRCYINPAAKNAAFLLARTVRLPSLCAYLPSVWVLSCPHRPAWRRVTYYFLNCIFYYWFFNN